MAYIYRLYDCGRVVYVGQAKTKKHMYDRLSSHTSDKEFDETGHEEVADCDVNEREATLISSLRPKYNKIFPLDREMISRTEFLKIVNKEFDELFNHAQDNGYGVVRDNGSKINKSHIKPIKELIRNLIKEYISHL